MIVNYKKIREVPDPVYSTEGAACFDLYAAEQPVWDDEYHYWEFNTGVVIEIPEGYVGLLFPRSSVSKTTLILANSVGVVDSDYRGEITFRYKKIGNGDVYNLYNKGDRIGQMMIIPIPNITLNLVEELSETERGTGGYGSTGK